MPAGRAGGPGSITRCHQYALTIMHTHGCEYPQPLRLRRELGRHVSPVNTGDPDHTGDTDLPFDSTRSPLSPVSPVARTREGFRSTTQFRKPGRVGYARANFSEPCGAGGDTGDTNLAGWTADSAHLRPTVLLLPDAGGIASQLSRHPAPRSRCPRPTGRPERPLRLRGWRQYGVVMAEPDSRLTWPDRELVRQLGVRSYGRRSGIEPNG